MVKRTRMRTRSRTSSKARMGGRRRTRSARRSASRSARRSRMGGQFTRASDSNTGEFDQNNSVPQNKQPTPGRTTAATGKLYVTPVQQVDFKW